MKISVTFPELNVQRDKIGASLSDWKIGSGNLDPRKELLARLLHGIEIDNKDIDVGPGQLLTYKGEQVILYIKDTRSSLWTLQNDPGKSRRFHVAECRTLERMRMDGRFERYVVTIRMDGLFLVDWLDPDTRERGETEAGLKVCKNCLSTLNWQGYQRSDAHLQLPNGKRQSKNEIWESFTIPDFLMDYSTFFRSKPSRRDTKAPLNVYIEDWPRISEKKRREARWRCEECRVDLSAYPGSLHCHHRNGVVTDNSSNNLRVLCVLCHAKQPGHQHMRVSRKESQLILNQRIKQQISSR